MVEDQVGRKEAGLVGTAFQLLRSEDAKALLASLTSVLALEGGGGVKRVVAKLIDDAKALGESDGEGSGDDRQLAN